MSPEEEQLEEQLDAWAERERQQMVNELGLPSDASLEDVLAARAEKERQKAVTKLGLPDNATWTDIVNTHEQRHRVWQESEGDRLAQKDADDWLWDKYYYDVSE